MRKFLNTLTDAQFSLIAGSLLGQDQVAEREETTLRLVDYCKTYRLSINDISERYRLTKL
jgi:hypothetical protein